LEVGAEGGFKLDLRQDCDPGRQDHDPGKQKLKGAIRTETYRRHYCQHSSFFCLLRKGGCCVHSGFFEVRRGREG
jgi:hypothetical protein